MFEATLEERVRLLSGRDIWSTWPIPRLGIPSLFLTDGPYGLRKAIASDSVNLGKAVPATCFPVSAALGATWNPELVARVAAAIGREAAANGVSVVLGPGTNIKRTPLCGRNFEYFSEDPLLSSRLAAAWISGIQSEGVGASLKHFAANNQETRRMSIDAIVDERALREIYLASFEEAVTAGRPWTVMGAYNRLNGTHCCEQRQLLTDVLRGEWGFDGVVLSDWGGAGDRAAATDAGCDLEMPGYDGLSDPLLLKAIRSGQLTQAKVETSAARIRTLAARTARAREEGRTYGIDDHHQLARRAAEESVVLLKNEGGLLPLQATGQIAVIGAFAKEPRFKGGGSSQVTPHRLDDAWTELERIAGTSCSLSYAAGYRLASEAPDAELLAEAREAARAADVVVAFVGLTDGCDSEGSDREHLRLPAAHEALIATVLEASPRVVVVLANGGPVEMPWAARVPAIVEGYLAGQAGGSAMARVLLGRADPGGRLAESFPIRWEENPVHELPLGPRFSEYRESVYVGYRYYDSAKTEVLFPFGHGLSYTTFAYDDLEVRTADDGQGASVAVQVTNTGSRPGWEVVQVYLHDRESSLFRPAQELRGFAKVWLQPGESRQVQIDLGRRAFAFWDIRAHAWAVEGGAFEIRIGASSRDIRATAAIEVQGDPGFVPVAESPAVAAAYRDLPLGRRFERRPFEALLGRPLEENAPDAKGLYTANTPLGDMDSWLARTLLRVAAVVARGVVGRDDPAAAALAQEAIQQMTPRMFRMATKGAVSDQLRDGLLLLFNGRSGPGLQKTIRGLFDLRRPRSDEAQADNRL